MIIEIFMLLALGDCVHQPYPVSCWEDRRDGVANALNTLFRDDGLKSVGDGSSDQSPCPVNWLCLPAKQEPPKGEHRGQIAIDCDVYDCVAHIRAAMEDEVFDGPIQHQGGDWLICAPPVNHIRHCKWIALPDSESDK